MLTNSNGNILVANAISFTNRKITVTTYNDINHYNSCDTSYIKKLTYSISIPVNFSYPKIEVKSDLSADEAISLYIEQIIIEIDSNWSTV